MRLEATKYLFDINRARPGERLHEGQAFRGLEQDAMLRSAVERQFEIIGEALSQLARLDEALRQRISEHRRIVAFRNILIHGYADVDDRLVWDVVESKLPRLRQEVEALLAEA